MEQSNLLTPVAKGREDYNKDIHNVLAEYKDFVPDKGIVVRGFLMEASVSKAGLIQEMANIKVERLGSQGVSIETLDSPWPFSRKAVVIAVPEGYTKYKPGDHILIAKRCVMARYISEAVKFHLPHSFTTDSWYALEPPETMNNPHYGYLIVNPQDEILGKLAE